MELLLVDTSQIQPYIFGSNRLRENIGASYLVSLATQDWVVHCLPTRHNVNYSEAAGIDLDDLFDEEKMVDKGQVAVEALYLGGGNAALLFAAPEEAQNFVKKYTRFVMEHAPNLQVVVAQEKFVWVDGQNDLHEAMNDLFARMEERKEKRARSAPLLGLGVTAVCRSTGLPAERMSQPVSGAEEETSYPASGEILTKLNYFSQANERLEDLLPPPPGYLYPYQLDHLGRSKGEHSYIAVVHADGDGIGKRLFKLGANAPDNRAYIKTRREFSEALKQASRQALEKTLKILEDRIEPQHEIVHYSDYGKEIVAIPFQKENDRYYLPIRPIIFGGDDLTIVCDGRLGLGIALVYMEAFNKATDVLDKIDGKGRATASAGVAIVKSHYPFSRAYVLSESLVSSAKQYKAYLAAQIFDKEEEAEFKSRESCLDWHFAEGGLLGGLKEIKQAHYCVQAGSLTLRPLSLNENPHRPYRTWQVVRKGIDTFQDATGTVDLKEPPVWTERRNKVKELRTALRKGGPETRQFLIKHNKPGERELPDVGAGLAFQDDGWHQKYCAYFDAIEAADWFIPLQQDKQNEGEDNA